MPATRVSVPLDPSELSALVRMAEADCRHPREQLRFLLRQAAQARGLLPPQSETTHERGPQCAERQVVVSGT